MTDETDTESRWSRPQFVALRRFALSITVFTILGHVFLGFEQSPVQPVVAAAVCYGLGLAYEFLVARAQGRAPKFAGGPLNLFHFLLPAHITGLSIALILYSNNRLFPMAFAAALAMSSKVLFRVSTGDRSRHYLNPSNFGISVTLLVFPWVGISPPYMFTENVVGLGDWLLPALIVVAGTLLNLRLTKRIPVIAGWLLGFLVQAIFRNGWVGLPIVAGLNPVTGVIFALFTFYMIPDPATTPHDPKRQFVFGLGVAFFYAVFMAVHVVFGFFFALTIVCFLRGGLLWYRHSELVQREAATA